MIKFIVWIFGLIVSSYAASKIGEFLIGRPIKNIKKKYFD